MLVAVLIAPVLALGSYFAVGHFFGEQPQPAREGQSYPLVEKPNCRYDSGRCGLVNADFELDLEVRPATDDQALLLLTSVVPLEGVMVSLLVPGAEEEAPAPMEAASPDGLQWRTVLDMPEPGRDRLRLVASAAGAFYFGDVATEFTRR